MTRTSRNGGTSSPTGRLPWTGNVRLSFAGDPKRQMLKLAGLGTSAAVWRNQARALAEYANVNVVVESLAGHDGTDTSFAISTAADWYNEAELQLLRQFTAHGTPVAVSGFSAGALVAVKLALTHPHAVRALFLTGYCPRLKSLAVERFLKSLGVVTSIPLLRVLRRSVSFKAESTKQLHLVTEEYLAQPRYARYPLSVLLSLLRLQDELRDPVLGVQCPVQFFHGAHDRRTAIGEIQKLARIMSAVRKAEVPLHEYSSSPHCVPLGNDAPAFTADLVTAANSLW